MMSTQKRISKKFRRGSILGAVIVIGLCLAILGFGMLQLGFGARVNSAISVSQISAREAADAGLTRALYQMNAAIGGNGNLDTSVFPATSVIHAVPMDSSNTTAVYQIDPFPGIPYPYYVVTSTGRVNNEERRTQTVHAVTRRSTYWFGVGVQDSFIVRGSALFGTIPPDSIFEGSVRTNSIENDAITIQSDNPIPGDVAYGPGGQQDVVIKTPGDNPEDVIDGSIYGTDNTLAFPDAQLPDTEEMPPGGWQLPPLELTTLTATDYIDTGMTDPRGLPIKRKTITWNEPAGVAYVFNGDFILPTFGGDTVWEIQFVGTFLINVKGNMIIPGNARLTIGDGVYAPPIHDRLELYLGSGVGPPDRSSMDAKNGAAIVTMPRGIDDPLPHSLDLKIFGLPTCSSPGNNPDITIYNSAAFWGVIYAPDARLDLRNSAGMYGGFIGKSIELYGDAEFFYDSRIPLEYDEGPYFFEIERWWEDNQHVDLPAS